MNLPNALTIARIGVAPPLFFLLFVGAFWPRLAAFVLFVLAAVSDVWDGYLARRRGQITDFGKLADPIADKLLLFATFLPFYFLPRVDDFLFLPRVDDSVGAVPYWGPLPLWVLLVIFGREVLVTLFRGYAVRRGVVIPAGKAGKYKTTFQNLFIGGLILWYALQTEAQKVGWSGTLWSWFEAFHALWVAVTLALAVGLTVYSLGVYLWQYRRLVRSAVG